MNALRKGFAVLLLTVSGVVCAQELPYSEGPVSVVTRVKVMDGQFDNYMAYLQKSYRPVMEAQKKAGNIISYSIYDASPQGPSDADLYLVVRYANMASFDGLRQRSEPVALKVNNQTREQANEATGSRVKMREILGSEVVRELVLSP